MKQTVVFPPCGASGGTSVKEAVTEAMSALKSGAYHDVAKGATAGAEELVLGNDPRLEDARSASDVFRWAKAGTKPSYTAEEVGAAYAVHDHPVATYAAPGFMSPADKKVLKDLEQVIKKGGYVNDTDPRLSDARTPLEHTHDLATSVRAGFMSTQDKAKLDGIESSSTQNATDAQLRDRTTHTGVQPIASVDGLQDALGEKVDTTDPRLTNAREWTATVVSQAEAEAGTSTTVRKWTAQRVRQAVLGWWNTSTFKAKLDGVEAGATKNATDAQLRDRTTHTGVQPITSVTNLQSSLDSKVDKQSGYGLSQENYTSAEKSKLASLEGSKFKGEYVSLAALNAAQPSPEVGSYAYVDLGVGEVVSKYIWDSSDAEWTRQQGETASLTRAEVKSLYEGNPDTNAFSDSEKSKLTGIATGATKNRADSENADKVHTHTWSQISGQPAQATRWPTFDEVTGKPTNYSTTWDSVAAKPAQATRWPTWSEVTSKPSTFAPSSHTHPVSQITGLGSAATTASTDYAKSQGRVVNDGNLFLDSGMYGIAGSPPNTVTGYGAMIVARNSDTGLQISGGHNSDKLHFRGFSSHGSTFTAWREVYHTGNMPTTATRWPTWSEVTSKPIVQTTGTSTANIMSQKATTDAINAAASGGMGPAGYTYTHVNGRVTKITDNSARDIVIGYNASGYVDSVTYPNGRRETFTYDSHGNVATMAATGG